MESVTSVNTTESGRIFVTGQGSGGLDTNALIEASYQQKLQPAVEIDERVESNVAKSERFLELQTFANDIGAAIESLVQPSRPTDTNAFDSKTGLIGTSSSTPAESLATFGIDSTAEVGSYNIEILQRAEPMVVASVSATTPDDALGLTDRTFTLGVQGGGSASIDITSTTTLNEMADLINAQTGATGISASVLQVGNNEYRLVLVGPELGSIIEYTNATDIFTVEQNQQDAIIELDGIQITRSNNDFSGIIEGVDIQVNNAEPGTNITLNIEEDASIAKDAILSMVETYNLYRDFYAKQQVLGEEGTEDEALLFADTTLRNLNNAISEALNSSYTTANGSNALGNIGITLNEQNRLSIDEAALDEALLSDYEGVRELFETNVDIDSTDAQLLRNSYAGDDIDFAIDITTDADGKITGASVGGNDGAFEVRDSRLIGATGTAYEGLTITYIGGVDTTLNVSVKTGLANKLANSIDRYADPENGIIQQEIRALDDQNEGLEDNADTIRVRADRFLEAQIERYSELEAAVSAAESLQRYLDVLLNGDTN